MFQKWIMIALAGIVLALPAFAANKNMEILGTFDNWTAYVSRDKAGKVCYIASEPTKSVGKYTRRDDVFLFVTHHPTEKTYDVVSVMAGYTYRKASKPTLTVDKNKGITLASLADTAWTRDGATDTKLVAQMKKGNTAVLRGRSKRGTATTDTFSLKGFSKAYREIQKACGRE